MSKSTEDFKEELKQIRDELYAGAETMDLRIVASYIDRLIISLDSLADNIESIEISVEEISNADEEKPMKCDCSCCKPQAKKAPKKKAKKAAKPKKRRK